MVVKTELCAFSETRIYPGHGSRFVNRTGQLIIFASAKMSSLFHQKKKPAKLLWTQAWRRLHKKLNVEAGVKKRARRVIKVQRGYVGASVEELKKRRAAAPKPAAPAAPAAPGATAAPKTRVVHAAVAEAKAKAKAARKAAPKSAPARAPAAVHKGGRGR